MTKIGTEVGHVTRLGTPLSRSKRSKVNLHGAGAYCGCLPHSLHRRSLLFEVKLRTNLANKSTGNQGCYGSRIPFSVRFQFVFHRKPRFRFLPGFGFYVKYGLSKTLTANIITLSENCTNLGLYSLYVESLVQQLIIIAVKSTQLYIRKSLYYSIVTA